ncbi:hypothetical protein DNK06_11020 [Pseudomonas daroniae]|uniref:ABC transporter domain-containing protein n=1 Tax=Phytopseudomonas daroniae TaxID=2487519 RepID=A0A4Q9QLX2_9GAMM|nr:MULTISPECIES: hypothetical protein [Pseudomonas]TBU80296.1 hypothetical protein DNK06_11020 [Pseudomonas daroniae]TBU85274.1 hypothetical protein DNK31_02730 [Pseudomonas sp. FRB 228]TBU94121.1 hypothetical protein DNJ99_02730 [Pseudomonas daroniae]
MPSTTSVAPKRWSRCDCTAAGKLAHSDHWENACRPGEQQRLAFAHVLLHRPDYLFLDEAILALDNANEDNLYLLLAEHHDHQRGAPPEPGALP